MRYKKVLMVTALALLFSCGAADVARLFNNVNLEKKGIHINLSDVPPGLYDKPFIIKFDKMLSKVSNGAVRVNAYNVYTVGNYDKISPQSIDSVANFLDPTCKFKDTWFGVYIILDDDAGLGRRFMLNDPSGSPGILKNISEKSVLLIPALDQKIISWSTHQNQAGYTWLDFDRDFYFNRRDGSELTREKFTDKQGRSWHKITGEFDTTAALTDVRKTSMKVFSSIRNYVGLPNAEVYKLVDPWHPIVIKGSVLTRYFQCSATKFWAVIYYNGSAFTDKNGKRVDNWENTDLRTVLERMTADLEIDCAR